MFTKIGFCTSSSWWRFIIWVGGGIQLSTPGVFLELVFILTSTIDSGHAVN